MSPQELTEVSDWVTNLSGTDLNAASGGPVGVNNLKAANEEPI